jgi:hypothetical protein
MKREQRSAYHFRVCSVFVSLSQISDRHQIAEGVTAALPFVCRELVELVVVVCIRQ